MSTASKLLYRLFMKQARELERRNLPLTVRMPVDKSAWLNGGNHGWDMPSDEYSKAALHRLFPWLGSDAVKGKLQADELKNVIRQAFRHPAPPEEGFGDPLDRAFTALRLMSEQVTMEEGSSTADTRGVVVDVTASFVGRQRDLDISYEPEEGVPEKLYFTYRVRVTNTSNQIVQLQARHWIIRNSVGQIITEVAKGTRAVVGCTPILKPGTCFQYYSGTDMEGTGGSMEGSFQMVVIGDKGEEVEGFDAEIAPFKLVPPKEVTDAAAVAQHEESDSDSDGETGR